MNFENFDFNEVKGFEWDLGNVEKNKKKHDLDKWQIEEVFFNEPFVIYEDKKHSIVENRWRSEERRVGKYFIYRW